ncbi:hypothetical protein SUGI_0673880 [Cryptomeria japonica]|nr:hypothetical protein SUGI_0673880 [Cryptomeria japonica]
MRKLYPARLPRFSAGGCRQVFATCPRSISVFSPQCKKNPATNEGRYSVCKAGKFGENEVIRANKDDALSLPSDGNWQVFRSKKAKRKMDESRNKSLNFDWHKSSASNHYPATGANLVPLGKVRNFETKPRTRQRRICKILANLMEPQFNLFSECGVFAKWAGIGEDTGKIIDWWMALYPGQISITILENNFLAILCDNQNTKNDILHGMVKLYKGYGFFRCEWKPNFDPHSQNLNIYPRWINLGTLPVEYLNFKILEYIGEQFGSFLGCEGLGKGVLNKNIKILVESDINSLDLDPIMLVSNKGEWNIHPTFYDGVINESDIRLKTCPALVNSIEQMENPLSDQHKKSTSNESPVHDNNPPAAYTDENRNNNSSNINDLDKIIDEANSIKEDALVEMTKRISDSVDSLKCPSDTKSAENLEQDNEADQEEMSSRMAVVLEVFDNKVVENLSPEEEAEKRFLIQELLASMDEEENNENRVGDIIPILVNDYSVAQPQLGVDDGEGVIVSQQTLGIKDIYDRKNFPDCAREAKSRGRKSLSELRLQDGNAKDQGKLTAFFDAGKGKGLPTAP